MVSKAYFPGIVQAFGWGLGALAAQPDDSPRHWITRAFGLLWAFVSIIFVAYYTATLTANLTVQKFDAQIASPSDLFGKKVCTVAGTTSAGFLRTLGVGATGATSINDCYDGIEHHKFDAVVFDSPVLRYYAAHDGAGIARSPGRSSRPRTTASPSATAVSCASRSTRRCCPCGRTAPTT